MARFDITHYKDESNSKLLYSNKYFKNMENAIKHVMKKHITDEDNPDIDHQSDNCVQIWTNYYVNGVRIEDPTEEIKEKCKNGNCETFVQSFEIMEIDRLCLQ